jgi:hypothetical protein
MAPAIDVATGAVNQYRVDALQPGGNVGVDTMAAAVAAAPAPELAIIHSSPLATVHPLNHSVGSSTSTVAGSSGKSTYHVDAVTAGEGVRVAASAVPLVQRDAWMDALDQLF